MLIKVNQFDNQLPKHQSRQECLLNSSEQTSIRQRTGGGSSRHCLEKLYQTVRLPKKEVLTSQVASRASASQAAWEALSCALRHQRGVGAAGPRIAVGILARRCSPSQSACWGGKCMRRVPGWCRWAGRSHRRTCTGWSWCGLCRS